MWEKPNGQRPVTPGGAQKARSQNRGSDSARNLGGKTTKRKKAVKETIEKGNGRGGGEMREGRQMKFGA